MMCASCLGLSGFATVVPYESPFVAQPLMPPGLPVMPQPMSSLQPVEIINTNGLCSLKDARHMYRMRLALQEMDNQFGFVPNGYFLDLG